MTLTGAAYKGYDRAFCVRMKSTLTKRGCHFKSSGYRVVLVLARLRPQYSFTQTKKSTPQLLGMVGLAIALPPPSVHEIRLECDMFVSRINFDFKIVHCEPKVQDLLDYAPEEIVGRNLYTLCHGEEVNKLRKCHVDLINKGQVLTHYYRMMNKNGGYTWLQTCATVICNSKNNDEQNIICVNYIVSGKEQANVIMDCCQYEPVKVEEKEAVKENGSKSPDTDPSPDGQERTSPRPNRESRGANGQSSTDKGSSSTNTDAAGSSKGTEECAEPEPKPPITRGRKRKNKAEVKETATTTAATEQINNLPTPEALKISRLTEETSKPDSAVKSLETVMSKHLSQTTDFSTDALLKHTQDPKTQHQQAAAAQQQHQQQSPPMQHWTGHNSHFYQPSPVPATALLQQIYVNRESVIRATTRPGSNGPVYPDYSHATPVTAPQDNDGSYDPGHYSHHLITPYSTYQTTGVDYHQLQNAMTPPSSVSPRENTPLHPSPYSHEPGRHPCSTNDNGSPSQVIGLRCNRSL